MDREKELFMNRIDYHLRLYRMQAELIKFVYDPKGGYQAVSQLRRWIQELTGNPDTNYINQFLHGRVMDWNLLEKCEAPVENMKAE